MVAASPKTLVATPAAAAPTVLQPGGGNVLTVGVGMEFATLGDALKASVDGQTIAVRAGTYTNDFGVVTHAVRIVAVGGTVNEVATVPPPNDKALLTADANLSIQGFTFTGGSDGSPDGNVAGIRLEAGNLAVSYCYFHDMQEGLLTGAIPNAIVTIDHSEFAHNGTGDGYTHNLYVGAVGSLTITNSYFHDANVGHEIKSRAAVTTITNNVIADGPTGTASYDIDIPNAGAATITGNVIEKGPMASNRPAIHYGGETQFAWTNNSLLIGHNTIINDFGTLANVVLNQAATNGLNTAANITGNTLYGFDPAAIAIGPATLSGNTVPAARPSFAAPATWAAVPSVTIAPGNQLLNLVNSNHTVSGGAAHLTVNDPCGSNTITGGAGGLTLVASGGFDQIATQAGATDAITLSGRNAVLHSAGIDHIIAAGTYEDVYATGAATITSAGFSTINLGGANEQLTATFDGKVNVGVAGNAHLIDMGGDLGLTQAGGGRLAIFDQAPGTPLASASTATVAGALTGWVSKWGPITISAGDTGASVQAGTGQVSVAGGAGADVLIAGAGMDSFSLGGGADQVVFGSGSATVIGGSGRDAYHFHQGAAGHDTITGFKQGTDVLAFDGFTGNAVASGAVAGGNTTLTLTDGTTILFTGVILPGYGAPNPTPAPGPGPTPPPSPTPPGGTGSLVLTQSGQSVSGGVAPLSVTDLAGGNTIAGGAGGLTVTAGWSDLISTAQGATDTLVLSRNDTLTGAGTDQVTCTCTGDVITEQGAATIVLQGSGAVVHGGAGLLTVTDTVGGALLTGGAGGISAMLAGSYDTVATAVGAADTVGLAGYGNLTSHGTDRIAVQGLYNQVTVIGAASIASTSLFSGFDLEGQDSLVAAGGVVTVGGGASATVQASGANDLNIAKLVGGALQASAITASGPASLTLSGGAASVYAASGTYARLVATTYGGVCVTAGAGPVSVTSQAQVGAAADTIQGGAGDLTLASGARGLNLLAGAGNVTLTGGGGTDMVTLGSGNVTVQGGGSDIFILPGAATGTLVVQNWNAGDSFLTQDGAVPVFAAETVTGGSTWLTLAGGGHVELVGVAHLGGA